MKYFKKKLFLFFLFFYLLIGSYNSINTGISFDERYEELNWNFHVSTFKEFKDNLLDKKDFNKEKFDSEVKNYVGYGIGFQLISQPIQYLIKDFLKNNKNLTEFGTKLVAKHLVVFLFFFISGIFFYLILKKIIDNENFNITGSIFYLTYPYLFGQSMFSPKDVPFMSVWLVCTYLSFKIFERLIDKNSIRNSDIFIFSILTAYLISIRFAGILILIQYSIIFLLYANVYKINFQNFIKAYVSKFVIFLIIFFLFIFIFNPIFLLNPFLILDTFLININHFNNVGTNTFGETMYSKDLPSTYLLIWFLVKIPLIILIGLLLIPFSEKEIFVKEKNKIFVGSILLTILLIPLILILTKAHLYDEIRQVMFLVPLILILGLISLYTISKKVFYFISIISISFFVIENIKINPYQYVWFNLPSRVIDITNKFELEYQGISGKEISQFLVKLEKQDICILANPIHGVKPFLKDTKFNCFDIWQKIDTDYKRPFLAVQNVRNLKKSMPYGCKLINEAYFKLLFHEKKFVTGKLLKCE